MSRFAPCTEDVPVDLVAEDRDGLQQHVGALEGSELAEVAEAVARALLGSRAGSPVSARRVLSWMIFSRGIPQST